MGAASSLLAAQTEVQGLPVLLFTKMSRTLLILAVACIALVAALPAQLPTLPEDIADPDTVVDEAPETLLPEIFAGDDDDFEESMAIPDDEDVELVQAKFGFGALMKGMGLKDENTADYGYGPAESPAPAPAPAPAKAKPAGSGSGSGMAPVIVAPPAGASGTKLFAGLGQ